MRRTALACLFVLSGLGAPLRAQDVGEQISALAEPNARGYVAPLARGLGHALTAGLVSSADPHGRLGFSVGVRAVGALFPDRDETFAVVAPGSVTYTSPNPIIGTRTYSNPYSVSNGGRSPTVAGEGPGAVLSPQGTFRTDLMLAGLDPDDFALELPRGQDFPAAPFAVIDAALGLGFGTQIMVRLIPTLDAGRVLGADGAGELGAFGVGVMHNLTQWLPIPTPMWDLSIAAGTQKVSLGDYFEASGNTVGLVASAGIGPLSAYAHASSYGAQADVDYRVENGSGNPGLPADRTRVAFAEEVGRTERLALGAQLDLVLLKLSAEYGMGDYRTISVRVALGVR